MAVEDSEPLTDEQVEAGLTRACMPPDDRNTVTGRPLWFNDYGTTSLMDAYRQGWMDAQESARITRIQQSIEQPGSVRDAP